MDQAERSRWRKASELLDEVLEMPPDQQSGAVEKLGALHGLTAELTALYQGARDASVLDGTLDQLLQELAGTAPEKNAFEGEVIGNWRLGTEIGRGGMSVVYHADRTGEDFQQHAALKILLVAHLGEDFVDGFVRERQILSDLQHPGIARLIDGGITRENAPYLVMEHVDGERIDHWCADRNADLETITRMMIRLCQAVAHAQRHLVVHQDIKPANVLVDGHDRPVLIDFGIASLIKQSGQVRSMRAFTPQFAAPEQEAGSTITTATDVYALGKLFLSLTQTQRPDRDLEAILKMATEKNPENRYPNARMLAEDLEAWLDKRPVRARPSTPGYRASRFIARNRWGVGAAAVIVMSVLGGLTAALWQAEIAAKERDAAQLESTRAQQVTVFLKDLFRASDPDQAQGEEATARELLDIGAYQVRSAMYETPALKVEMLILLGDLYRALGEMNSAGPLLEEGLALADELGDLELRVEARRALATQRMESGEHEEALRLARRAEEMLRDAGAIPGLQHASLMQAILFSMSELGQSGSAADRGRDIIRDLENHPNLGAKARYQYFYSVGNVMLVAEQTNAADDMLQRAARLADEIGLDPTEEIALYSNLAGVQDRVGNLEAELEYRRRAMTLAERIYPPDHPDRARKLSNLGATLNHMGRYPEAQEALREALAIYERIYPDHVHPRVAAAHNNLALSLKVSGNFEAAEFHTTRAWEAAAELFGTEDPRYVIATGNLGDLHRQLGNLQRAEELLDENLALRRSLVGPDHRLIGSGLTLLANLRLDQGKPEEALRLCDEALAMYQRIGFENLRYIIPAMARRARALTQLGRPGEAQQTLQEAMKLAEPAISALGRAWPELLAARARFLVDQAEPGAQDAIVLALEAHRDILGPDHPETLRIGELAKNMRR